MFIGKGAKTFDFLKANEAEEMLAKGIDPREVWRKTGTMRGVDNHLRQEIPDNEVDFLHANKWGAQSKHLAENRSVIDPIQNLMPHQKLADAYPDVNPMTIIDPKREGFGGEYLSDKDIMRLSVLKGAPMQPEGMPSTSTALHELQHAIQQQEGWARGGSDKEFLWNKLSVKRDLEDQITAINEQLGKAVGTPKYNELMDLRSEIVRDLQKQGLDDPIGIKQAAHEQYKRLAGEAEARLTQSRMNMNMDERLASYPYDMLDVPMDQLIVRGLLR
jgi:hypothetical protein